MLSRAIERIIGAIFCLISCVQPSFADDDAPGAVSRSLPSVQLWKFKGVNEVFTRDRAIYLDLAMADGTRKFWNPVNGELKPAVDVDIKTLSRAMSIPAYTPEDLWNGGTIKMSIESSGARCGYTVGVNFTYIEKDQTSATFYIIEKYKPPKKTFYCGTPLLQQYDVEGLYWALTLPDNRLLVIDFAGKQAIAFEHVPSTIVALDDQSLLVPASLLKPALDAAQGDQAARYQALLAALKNHPATVIQSVRVE